jgi:hypothetical protein
VHTSRADVKPWDSNAWTSKRRHKPPLCLLPTYRRQENHTLDEFRVPAWSSRSNAVAHCVHEYKNIDNVHSGERSQEIIFDYVSAEAGIWRHAETVPGHRYQIEAWGKHVRSDSPVELSLCVDLTSGQDWQATSMEWYHWDETGEDVWCTPRSRCGPVARPWFFS